jgi:diacylglycerol O-acyltransferase / wax synthase
MTATAPTRYPLRLDARMQPTDALFWYAEQAMPELRPLVAGLLMLDRRPQPARLRASVERWVARLPRLRQRVAEAPLRLGLPQWEDDPHFELEYHAREVVLPAPAGERHLLDFVGAVFATPLDPMRPLWEAYLIEGLDGGRAACFFKVHHAVMDGVGSLAVFEALTQSHRTERVIVPRFRPPLRRDAEAAGFGGVIGGAIVDAAAGLAAAASLSARLALRPGDVIDDVGRAARSARGLFADLMAPPTADPLARDSTGIGRRLDAMTLPLPRLRRIKDALGCTLNDVVLTAVSGAVGRYHQQRKLPVDELHCMVPMSLRRSDERQALGNRVGAFNVMLPVGEPDALKRLARIQRQSGAAKRDRRSAAYPILMRGLALLPVAAYRLLAQTAIRQVNLICTNMPGPAAQRYLAGAKVEAIHPFAPVALGIPISIALLSYGDTYGIGIDTDPAAIPDPETLRRDLAAAVDDLERRALPPARRRAPKRAKTTRRAPKRAKTTRRAPKRAKTARRKAK